MYIEKAISLCKIFGKSLNVNLIDGKFLVTVPYAWKKESPSESIMSSFAGRGETMEEACRNLCSNASGFIVVDDGVNPRKEQSVIII